MHEQIVMEKIIWKKKQKKNSFLLDINALNVLQTFSL